MFYLAVVFEKSNIVAGSLDPENPAQLVVHLDRIAPHVMLDSGPFDAGMKVVADLSLEAFVELATEEGRHALRLDRVDCRTDQFLVHRSQILDAGKDDVSGILHLHQAPVVTGLEVRQDWAQPSSNPVQGAVQGLSSQAVGQSLSSGEVLDLDEDVVDQPVANPLLA